MRFLRPEYFIRKRFAFLLKTIKASHGFTLIELIIVVAILSMLAALVVPKFVNVFGGGKGEMLTFTSMIAKTFDNAFLREEQCFLAIHCASPDVKTQSNDPNGIMSRENGVSVTVFNKEGFFEDTKNRSLPRKRFPSSFRVEEIILSNGEKITQGTVLIPFTPDGFSSDTIVHILSGQDRYSVIIYRLKKEPRVFPDFVDFEAVRTGEIL
jgi:prepilin-type N-terminal cleavage/methylation domain-containing protein